MTTGVCKYAKIKPEKHGSFSISLHQNHEISNLNEHLTVPFFSLRATCYQNCNTVTVGFFTVHGDISAHFTWILFRTGVTEAQKHRIVGLGWFNHLQSAAQGNGQTFFGWKLHNFAEKPATSLLKKIQKITSV